jgi:hypothetical protein
MIGRMRGHWQIAAKVGAGGRGEVYRARDTKPTAIRPAFSMSSHRERRPV